MQAFWLDLVRHVEDVDSSKLRMGLTYHILETFPAELQAMSWYSQTEMHTSERRHAMFD